MYSNSTRLAPQVTYAKRAVKVESIYTRMKYVAPISKKFPGSGQPVTYVPG